MTVSVVARRVAVQERRRWVEAVDFRHATYGPPVGPGDEVATLCGGRVLVCAIRPGSPAAECPACDRLWRDVEGIPQRAARATEPGQDTVS